MAPSVTIVGAGAMGAAVGRRLVERGVAVLAALAGRSEASLARARAAGMTPAADAEAANVDFLLSIVPPGTALAVAERFAPVLLRSDRKPIFADCNAVNPQTVNRIAAVIQGAGCAFVDAGIVGGPPREGYNGPTIYASGPSVRRFETLAAYGLDIRVLDEGIGTASAVKMSYAGITKGLQALAAAMILAASRAGAAEVLHAELAHSQPALLAWFERQLPQMYGKAHRWVAEMEEIAGFAGEDAAAGALLSAAARLYRRLADDFGSERREIDALEAFFGRPRRAQPAAPDSGESRV